jgi:hypothetical protein
MLILLGLLVSNDMNQFIQQKSDQKKAGIASIEDNLKLPFPANSFI